MINCVFYKVITDKLTKCNKSTPFKHDLSRPKRRVSKFHEEPWYYHVEISILDPFREENIGW